MLRCGLLGRTLAHSYSPALHELLGGDSYTYRLFEVSPENLPAFLEGDDWDGLNVTIPYKQAVIPFCKHLSPAARAIGSVNTIRRMEDGSLHGSNTDAVGFKHMIHRLGISVKHKKVLVLGSGGSSRTVCHVLKEQNASDIIVISRNGPETYDNLSRHSDAQIIVNTTPVGMYPETEIAPVNLTLFPQLEGVLDLVYNPARTRLLMDAKNQGIPHIGGLPMLAGQAAEAAAMFSGKVISTQENQAACNLLRRKMENLILIGMPGAGKTTIGHLIAEQMGRPFIDTDQEIEQAAGQTIPEIFRREGEAGFRERETAILKKFGKESGLVIATGGGAPTQQENYFHLRQNGVIFFLERNLSLLAHEGRPLSQKGGLPEMYIQRRPLYQRFADAVIENKQDPQAAANQALEVFYEILTH